MAQSKNKSKLIFFARSLHTKIFNRWTLAKYVNTQLIESITHNFTLL